MVRMALIKYSWGRVQASIESTVNGAMEAKGIKKEHIVDIKIEFQDDHTFIYVFYEQ